MANGQFIWSTNSWPDCENISHTVELDAKLMTLAFGTHFESLIFGAAVFNICLKRLRFAS